MADREKQQEQIEKATKLQDLLLDYWTNAALAGTLTSTDAATITRLLSANGWTLDPAAIPKDLRSKLTSDVKFDDDIGDEAEARPRLVG